MKRQKARAKKSRTQSQTTPAATQPSAAARRMSRRSFLQNVAFYSVAAAVAGGGGLYLVNDVMADARERDLTRIGNGVPAVVQIHDPGCPRCLALQRQTRDALRNFEEEELQYLVADINTSEGRALAGRYGVGHVTLLLMDASGKRLQTLTGEAHSEVLTDAFKRLIKRSQARS